MAADPGPGNGSGPPGIAPSDPVGDEVWLYRLVKVVNCEAVDGRWQFQSSAFANPTRPEPSEEMSVVLGDHLALLGRAPDDLPEFQYRDASPEWGVAKLRADCVRAIESERQEVRRPRPTTSPPTAMSSARRGDPGPAKR